MIYDKFRVQLTAPGIDYGYEYRTTLKGCIKFIKRRQAEEREKRERSPSLVQHYPVPRGCVYGKNSNDRYPGWVLLGTFSSDGVWTTDGKFLVAMGNQIYRRREEIAEFHKTIDEVTSFELTTENHDV